MNTQINEAIRAREVRLIDQNGQQLGIKAISDALELAYTSGMDLVNVAPESKPPVCKIIDYGKYKFEQQKKEKLNRSNQKTIVVKEIKLSPTIGDNDLSTKIRHALKFLQDDNKVKLSIQFRGRAIVHQEVGKQVMEKFIVACASFADVEHQPKLEGRSLVTHLKPKK